MDENVRDTCVQFNDIGPRLQDLNARLPKGAGPILFQSDFGDTTTLMISTDLCAMAVQNRCP